ncbi:hypothetical protein [Shewanella sp.]|uniref:hypothetical protein n=1 Tax=Gammaproteobacteria TaxID=1236 RepID=UPI001B61EC97|nr:hypothetical protein [Shewanella sp.]MBP6518327.1 hypothetical protein [Shewanella sp.]
MDEVNSRLTYFFATVGAFFSGFTLYEIGFLFGLIVSVVLGVLNYLLNRRSQQKRTEIWADYVDTLKRQSELGNATESVKEFITAPKQDL